MKKAETLLRLSKIKKLELINKESRQVVCP